MDRFEREQLDRHITSSGPDPHPDMQWSWGIEDGDDEEGELVAQAATMINGGVLTIPGEPPRAGAFLSWQEITDLRDALHNMMPNDDRSQTYALGAKRERLEALEARLGALQQTLPNPLDQHLTKP